MISFALNSQSQAITPSQLTRSSSTRPQKKGKEINRILEIPIILADKCISFKCRTSANYISTTLQIIIIKIIFSEILYVYKPSIVIHTGKLIEK